MKEKINLIKKQIFLLNFSSDLAMSQPPIPHIISP